MTVYERVCKAAALAFGIEAEELTEQTSPDDIAQWDSIGHMMFTAELEKEFDIRLDIDAIMEINTIGKAVEAVK